MNILLLGSGGREHALAWKMAASPLTDRLFCAPGNAGIAQEAQCAALDLADHAAIIAFCRANSIDFVVVGPEAPLCAGIVSLAGFGKGTFVLACRRRCCDHDARSTGGGRGTNFY